MEHNEKVVKIPITYKQRKLNVLGDGHVPCEVSERWLQFPDTAEDPRWLPVDVMTMGSDDLPRKICELVLNKEDLLRAVNAIKYENN